MEDLAFLFDETDAGVGRHTLDTSTGGGFLVAVTVALAVIRLPNAWLRGSKRRS